MLEQARVVAAEGSLQPVMLLATKTMAEKAERCREEGLAFLDLTGAIEEGRRAQGGFLGVDMSRLDAWLARFGALADRLPLCLIGLLSTRRRLRAEYAVFEALCREHKPAAVMVPGDRELSPVPAMLRVGLDLDIPTIIGFSGVPYAGSGLELMRSPYRRFKTSLRDLPPLLNFVAARRFPGQVKESNRGPLLFSPGWLTLAHAAEDMLSANPWIQGGGHSRHLLQHNRRFMDYFETRGLDPAKSVLMGDVNLDPLYEACQRRDELRAEIIECYGLPAEDKLVVVSVPNDYEHEHCDWETHNARMHAFLGRLALPGLAVLLSLHPKSEPNRYRPLAERYGFRLADSPIAEVLPAVDLFVLSCSSTLIYAKLAAVPIINLDYLGVRDDDYRDVPGLENVETPEDFGQAIGDFLSGVGPQGREALPAFATALAEDALFDGRAHVRLCDFLKSLAERPTGRRLSSGSL